MNLPDSLDPTPISRSHVALPGDATGGVVILPPLCPIPTTACRSIRWMGAGAATLWYAPAAAKTSGHVTASEAAAGEPVTFAGRKFYRLLFLSQGETQDVPMAVALLADDGAGHASTAGTWAVSF